VLFAEAVDQLRVFLRKQGHSGPVVWIVPGDVAFWFNELLVRPSIDAAARSELKFSQASQKGFGVSVEGIAKLDHSICCFVFAPDDSEDAARNFVAPPLTLKVRQDLRTARQPGALLWWVATRMRSRHAQLRALSFFGHDIDRRGLAT
jgi:hypothetical protein